MKSRIATFLVLFLAVIITALLSGCSSIPAAIKAAAGDPAIITGKITSVYGVGQFTRVGAVHPGTTVSASPDGTITVTAPATEAVTKTSGSGELSVPVKITLTQPTDAVPADLKTTTPPAAAAVKASGVGQSINAKKESSTPGP